MHKVTNDFKFDAVKDEYCPTCYFDKDVLLKRGNCLCKKQVVKETIVIKEKEHDIVDTAVDMAVGYAVGEMIEGLFDNDSSSSSSDSFDGFGGGESGGAGADSEW